MVCPKCGWELGVIETCAEKDVIYRRRKCKMCGSSFHTAEKFVPYDHEVATAWSNKRLHYKYQRSKRV